MAMLNGADVDVGWMDAAAALCLPISAVNYNR
jgi:hypothetical protein